MKNIHRYDLPTGFHSWGHRLHGDRAKVRTTSWSRYHYGLRAPLGSDGSWLTGCDAHIALSRKAAGEGMVLLENNGVLPLQENTTVALFGIGSLDYMKGGGGSGVVYSRYTKNLYTAFGEKEPEYHIYEPLTSFYYHYALPRLKELGKNSTFDEPEVPDAIVLDAAARATVAIITICRMSAEGEDRKAEKGDFYLSDSEQSLIKKVTKAFRRTVVVLNIGAVMDLSWIRQTPGIDAALLAWQAGMEGCAAVADILCGEVNPSGKLADTVAKSYRDYPSTGSFFESQSYVGYYEDIYVGYRYFETLPGAEDKVVYPFGYGLSYTQFRLSKPEVSLSDTHVCMQVRVKNVGNRAGREVVQAYFSAPRGKLGKSNIQLAAFQKTALLEPGQQEQICLQFPITDMASYDDLGQYQAACYVLEKGCYRFFAGNQCRQLQQADTQYCVQEAFRVVQQLTQQCAPVKLRKRLRSDGSYELLPQSQLEKAPDGQKRSVSVRPEDGASLEDVAQGRLSLEEFVEQLSDGKLIALTGGISSRGVANTGGIGGIASQIPGIMTADGPAGIRLEPETGIAVTSWPCATLLACTWDPELIQQIGVAGALEAKENALGIWLAPGMNIHRDPLCGRNFEYYSEDPLLTGKMGAAMVRGIQSVGIAATPKHFACNNKETNRMYSDSLVSERALREIYLRGFEICVREADPWLIMTAYNILNGRRCCENGELLKNILRGEWGYKGAVISDWGVPCDPVQQIASGNDIHMPVGFTEELSAALENGSLTRQQLCDAAKSILTLILKLQ